MKNQKIHASTQKFTEIIDIVDNIVLMEGGAACLVIEITASNFALLSKKEQDSKIFSYAALLNSLTFPIQILVRNKRMDISSYLKDLEKQELATQNQLLAQHIRLYRDFVREMVKVNIVLNKSFYVVIPFSPLEAGVAGVKQNVGKNEEAKEAYVATAQKSLLNKAESLHQQLAKLAISAKTLEKEELIKLFYDIFNDGAIQGSQADSDLNTPLIKAAR